jgi:hypothetical protein
LAGRLPFFVLKFPVSVALGVDDAPELRSFNCAERPRSNRLSRRQQFRTFGISFVETDVEKANLEITIAALMSGQYGDPLRVVAFNTTEHWAEDVAREILRRFDLAGDELPSCLEGFIARHVGPDRQLTLRLA